MSDWRAPGRVVWDNHACAPLRPGDTDFLPVLERYRDAGFTTVSLNVGFALEVDSNADNARKKLKAKNLDMIIMNNPTSPGIEFGGDFNIATIFTPGGKATALEKMSKKQLASKILDKIEALRKK